MTEEYPDVIDVEAEEITTTVIGDSRPFFLVTHKSPLARSFEAFGGQQNFGGTVDPATTGLALWWCSQDWAAQVLAAGPELPQLLAPTPGFVARLDRKWLQREVGHLRKGDIASFYAKHPVQAAEHPQVVVSTGSEHTETVPTAVCLSEDLARGDFPAPYDVLPDDVLVQLDQPVPCVVEVRYWTAHGELTAAAPYRIGVIGWESALFLEMLFNDQGRDLITLADTEAARFAAEVYGPPGYAFDLGVTLDGTVTVLRAWPSWSAEPFSADPTGVFRSIVASHDFDQVVDYDIWRWDPDLRIYDRSILKSVENEGPAVPENESGEEASDD